ncbi:ADL021Wp [Eremothecium gossypii ATCC 10895]|uniref:1,3-beta-glucanosyltransferase n=1 Tax=Eremothecium gossypii (strain ATCC 10895 / CBS 109.51 / FGSC 9923 / NRRL Y-1056) TaxID=284811 RepID=Q75AD8_EREGS|nr:ADL021Wp [Eremothecium gossypii ATCC 10895]AAS51900.2 ADL021Wp [Eremothecium gossypii ATCC 10895]AEY96199.1 FADL021Wp [Eremothecium gossypii FDAG1]
MRLGANLAAVTLALAVANAASDSSSSSMAPIEVRGNAFFKKGSDKRFYIRGVDYQPGGTGELVDPLADTEICKRDVENFKELGLNAIRVYTVDNTKDHDECMKMLADAGIYLILDVNTPKASISRFNTECSYNANYLQHVFATVDAFQKYDNLLGFFAGNEVINDKDTTETAPYVKAVVRDMKKYMKAKKYRKIPVGYSAADVAENRVLAAQYFNCGDDEDARIDMLGVNDYSWCGSKTFRTSGYSEKMNLYEGYSVPIFLSEYGCNTMPGAREFGEVSSIFSEKMSSLFSGGLAFEYSMEGNNFGLVEIKGGKVKKLEDFENLKKQYAEAKDPEGDAGYSKDGKPASCPPYDKGTWDADTKLPEMPKDAEAFFKGKTPKPNSLDLETQSNCGGLKDSGDSSAKGGSSSSASSASSGATATAKAESSSSAAPESSSSAAGAYNAARVPLAFYWVLGAASYLI